MALVRGINLVTLLWTEGDSYLPCDYQVYAKVEDNLTQLKSNRLINADRAGNRAVSEVPLAAQGQVVHLKGYGMIRVFRKVTPEGHAEY